MDLRTSGLGEILTGVLERREVRSRPFGHLPPEEYRYIACRVFDRRCGGPTIFGLEGHNISNAKRPRAGDHNNASGQSRFEGAARRMKIGIGKRIGTVKRLQSTHACLSPFSCPLTGVLCKRPFAELVAKIRIR